ncbi:MAG: hypothetical protein K8S25_02050 [Alphaproteobacteria bacterium]|nr:hypothetical protein [Alphaproteobacteria bacterium]
MIMSRLQTLADPLGRKKFTGPLDIRAPEDHLVMEHKRQEAAPITSPAIEASLEDFDAAMRSGLKDAVAASTKKIVDATSAYFRMSGVPTFAHDPVPPQLIKAILPAEHLAPGERTAMAAHRFVDLFEDSVKPMLREQVAKHLGRSSAFDTHTSMLQNKDERDANELNGSLLRNAMARRDADSRTLDRPMHTLLRPNDEEDERMPLNASDSYKSRDRDVGGLRTLEYDEGRDKPVFQQMQGAPFGPPPKKSEPPRIVRPGRRYSSDNMAQEDADADALARDADISIRSLRDGIESDRSFTGDRDLLVQQFLNNLRRYYVEGSDRAIAIVGPSNKQASIYDKGHLAAYDPTSDRIVFSIGFKKLTPEEKIITLIHEVLHTTLLVKNLQARNGYSRDREGGMIFAHHEADLDNIAIRYAKRLHLIRQNYPETSWRQYYKPPQ